MQQRSTCICLIGIAVLALVTPSSTCPVAVGAGKTSPSVTDAPSRIAAGQTKAVANMRRDFAVGLEERDGVGLDGLYDELVARQGLSRFARRAEADAPPAKPAKNSGNQATTGPSRAAKSKTRDLDLKAAREAVKAVNDQNGQPFLNHVFHLVS